MVDYAVEILSEPESKSTVQHRCSHDRNKNSILTKNNPPSRENTGRTDSGESIQCSTHGGVQPSTTVVLKLNLHVQRHGSEILQRGPRRFQTLPLRLGKHNSRLTNVWATGFCVHCHRLWNSIGVMPDSAHASTRTCASPLQ